MCGIAGIALASAHSEQIMDRVSAMLRSQLHRGPDGGGVAAVACQQHTVVFGHRRLAIIDLSPGGHQPMQDPATGNWITFNGEIYNYRELRAELAAVGQKFTTECDTEVILKAYAVWGSACVTRLRGIFAFAIWDRRRAQLVSARDQLGVKPFYYWYDANGIVFASEVRAILAAGVVPRRMDLKAVQSYLAYGSVQDPYTLVHDVLSLDPGHVLTWKDGMVSVHRFWALPAADIPENSVRTDAVRAHLLDAVSSQLVADVPLGAFLSGGIDSTAIASLMKQSGASPLRTFSVVFDEPRYDERKFSQSAATHIGTTHTELLLTGSDVHTMLPRALAAFDQPSVDGLNTYFVSKVTKEAGLTVALSGVGGDEVFAGYDGFRKALLAERWGNAVNGVPPALRRGAGAVLQALPFGGEKLRKAAEVFGSSLHPYFASRRLFSSRQATGLLADEFASADESWQPDRFTRIQDEARGYDPVNRASAFELQTYMLSTLLRDTDQMSMAHALEVRVPFLDHRLVEYMLRLPGYSKIMPGEPKHLLTAALGDGIPAECIHRPKRGFELPFRVWLQSSMRDECEASFMGQDRASAAPFSPHALQQLWKAFQRQQLSWSRIWSIFVLRDWLNRHQIAV